MKDIFYRNLKAEIPKKFISLIKAEKIGKEKDIMLKKEGGESQKDVKKNDITLLKREWGVSRKDE